jgi:hypothetical protein
MWNFLLRCAGEGQVTVYKLTAKYHTKIPDFHLLCLRALMSFNRVQKLLRNPAERNYMKHIWTLQHPWKIAKICFVPKLGACALARQMHFMIEIA